MPASTHTLGDSATKFYNVYSCNGCDGLLMDAQMAKMRPV
jgi:hypothetical protein